MARVPLGKDLATELLKAMGCPIDLCQSVSIEMERDSLVTVEVRYSLDTVWLEKASAALKADG